MKDCKNLKIYKFYYGTPMNNDEQISENWRRAEDMNNFKRNLIDNFCQEKYDDLIKYTVWAKTRIQYSKPWLSDQMDIGIDMLSDIHSIKFEHHWGNMYIGVPLEKTAIINFFEANKPSWVTTVKRI